MPTEFLHALYDGGAGAGLWDYWEVMRKSRVGGGGFIWALLDECVARTDRGGRLDCAGNMGADGVVGPHREREGSFYAVREIWSPVQLTGPRELTEEAPRVAFAVENRFDFINLEQCSFEWRLARFPSPFKTRSGHVTLAASSLKGPHVTPHGAGELKIKLPPNWKTADALYLTAKDPAGREIWTWLWGLKRALDLPRDGGEVTTRDEGGSLYARAGTTELRFDKLSGLLAEVRHDGKLIPFGNGPRFLAFRRDERKFVDISGPSEKLLFEPHMEGGDLIVDVHYNGALKRTRWRVSSGGVARLDYEYAFDGAVDLLGVQFDAPEKAMRGVRWLGRGPYRVWQNRTHGTRLDVWENSYNDTTPGESWNYPEFKGYFAGWRWAAFETTAGRVTVVNESSNSHLGVYKPKDGRDGLLDLPETGLAILDVLPAIGSKFQTPDTLGPQSQPQHVSGTTRGSLLFRFGSVIKR